MSIFKKVLRPSAQICNPEDFAEDVVHLNNMPDEYSTSSRSKKKRKKGKKEEEKEEKPIDCGKEFPVNEDAELLRCTNIKKVLKKSSLVSIFCADDDDTTVELYHSHNVEYFILKQEKRIKTKVKTKYKGKDEVDVTKKTAFWYSTCGNLVFKKAVPMFKKLGMSNSSLSDIKESMIFFDKKRMYFDDATFHFND